MARPRIQLVTDLDGHGFPGARRRPWRWLIAGLGLLLLFDLVLTLVRPSLESEAVLADDARRARAVLTRVTQAPRSGRDAWLLMGDSVLAGDVMRGVVPQWSEHRVIDSLRHEQGPQSTVAFEQIALDGLLPVDMLQIVRELDRLDPTARVGVVIEINPRYFSRHYRGQRACTREHLCELGWDPPGPARWSWALLGLAEAGRWIADHVPVVRHRDLFPRWDARAHDGLLPRTTTDEAEADPDANADARDPLAGRARILEHYEKPRMDARSAQFRALAEIVARLRARGRRAYLFATPLSDGFMAGTLDGSTYGNYIGRLDRLVNRPGDRRVRFASLDHPSLTDGEFIDHAHLHPAGNRWLAINLLHQLGIPLARTPPAGMLAYEEGPDRSLVAQVARGGSDGAPWQAAFRGPDGIAIDQDAGRIVIADTGNHCIREMVGPMTTVHISAGRGGRKGDTDGPRNRALFTEPRQPAIADGRIYVVDGTKRQRLREIDDSWVRTRIADAGPMWHRIDRLRSDGHVLWLLDEERRILRFDPRTGHSETRVEIEPAAAPAPTEPTAAANGEPEPEPAPPPYGIVAFDVRPDGGLYFADSEARVWQLDPDADTPQLLFANTAPTLLPQGTRVHFPHAFDEIALEHVADLRWVERYDAVLVADEHGVDAYESRVTERIHLRLLVPWQRMVYPWVHPLAHGGGYMFHNRNTHALSSNVHLGSMAIDQRSATLIYAERYRSRVVLQSDGLWGAAKIGHHITPITYGGIYDAFGREMGESALLSHHPERWLHRRLEPLPREGPYLGLMLGSSMSAVTDTVGQYSLARVMERHLTRALGVREGVRFDMVQRAYRGPKLSVLVKEFESFVEHQTPVDVVFFEAHRGRLYSGLDSVAKMMPLIDRIRRAAERYDTLVVMLDNDSMVAAKRDALRMASGRQRRFLKACEAAGFLVLRPEDLLLRASIDHAPWGNAPFERPHGSTWAVDLTAEQYAAMVYPRLREHLRDRVPAIDRPHVGVIKARDPLTGAFGEVDIDTKKLPKIEVDAMQQQLDGDRLELFVDLAKVGRRAKAKTQAQRDRLVLAYLTQALLEDPTGRLAAEVTISLARFSNYDEYGVGVSESARIVDQRSYDRATLRAFLQQMGGTERVRRKVQRPARPKGVPAP